MFVMESFLEELKTKRPLFCSELDFQIGLASQLEKFGAVIGRPMLIKKVKYQAEIRPDLLLITPQEKVGIIAKFFSIGMEVEIAGEKIPLPTQGGKNLKRYDFWKGVQKLEWLKKEKKIDKGYLILLTNDRLYWLRPLKETHDRELLIYDGRVVEGPTQLKWSGRSPKERKKPIEITGKYLCDWKEWYKLDDERRFKYLLLEV
jgi:hypothetical protein